MWKLVVAVFLGIIAGATPVAAQKKLHAAMEGFHAGLTKNGAAIEPYIHKKLSYGHSNGWIENYEQIRENLGKKISYKAFAVDSVEIINTGKNATVRFKAGVNAFYQDKNSVFNLKVMELWVRKWGKWKLLARQAISII